MSRNVLVTGANGFIGSNIVHALCEHGFDVRALVRTHSDCTLLAKEPVPVLKVSSYSTKELYPVLKGIDVVIHTAGRTVAYDKADYQKGNVEITRALHDACSMLETPPRILHMSSLAAGGPCMPGLPRAENHLDAPVSAYGESKLAAEKIWSDAGEKLAWTIVRPTIVYGPGDKAMLPLFRLAKNGLGFRQAGGKKNELSFIYVADLVEAIIRILRQKNTVGEVYYLCDGKRYLAEELWQAFPFRQQRLKILPVPRPVLFFMTACRHLGGKLLHLAPSFLNFDKFREATQPAWTCTIEKAGEHFGFEAVVPLNEGLQRTNQWYAEHGWL